MPEVAGLPQELTWILYNEGARTFFDVVDNSTASFRNYAQGKIYLYNTSTRMYGIGNINTGKIITYHKASERTWNKAIKNNYK